MSCLAALLGATLCNVLRGNLLDMTLCHGRLLWFVPGRKPKKKAPSGDSGRSLNNIHARCMGTSISFITFTIVLLIRLFVKRFVEK